MMIVKRVGPLSVAKICFALYGLMGLFFGAMIALGSTFLSRLATGVSTPDGEEPFGIFGLGLGMAAIVIFPVVYAVLGFIVGLISAALYNLVAGMMGGVEIDVS